MDILILRFDAPLMSFGGVLVDQDGPTERFPGLSMITGLFANALGYRHGDAKVLNRLQERILYAARWDTAPELVLDYHTVDFSQKKMREPGWTTRGRVEHRTGGPGAKFGTHQRYRYYWANGIMTVAVSISIDEYPDVEVLEKALERPKRPLFLGRKTCLPAAPICLGKQQATDVFEAVRRVPRAVRPSVKTGTDKEKMEACWPIGLGPNVSARQVTLYDRRDWRNQIHAGSRVRLEGLL